MRHLVIAAVLSIAAWTAPDAARAQTPTPPPTGAAACTQWITSVPFAITAPGYYCLKQNIATNLVGGAFTIDASDVTLDCRGRSVTHTDPNNESTGLGGGGMTPVQNVTVRGCRFIGFGTGIVFTPGSEHIEILSNDVIKYRYDAIVMWTNHTRIAGNNVLSGYNTDFYVMHGIVAAASDDVVIANNVVSGAQGAQWVWGIALQNATNVLVNNNQVVDLRPADGGYAVGIIVDGGSAATARVVSNVMMSRIPMSFGIDASTGATCTRNIGIGLERSGFDTCTVNVANIEQP
jgi:nitrous oxidase accessory protein NosD